MERCRHGNDSKIDLMFDRRGSQRIVVMFCDLFRVPISIGPLLMYFHRFDCDHIQCYSCFGAVANAHEYQPKGMSCVKNPLNILEMMKLTFV